MWREQGAVREGDWKLIYHPFQMELFNLREDIGETKNLYRAQTEIAKSLKQSHEDWVYGNRYTPSYLSPKVKENIQPQPEGDVLEITAIQTKRINDSKHGQFITFALGAGKEGTDDATPGDRIEYDICVAEDGMADGFFYTPSQGWSPKFTKETGFDQFGRLQSDGPAPKGGKGVWEHRVVGIGNIAPLRMPFNMVCLASKETGKYHFYLDNVVLRKSDGTILDMWKDGSDTFRGWKTHLRPPEHQHESIQQITLKTIPLEQL
jgi:hypothetical protein